MKTQLQKDQELMKLLKVKILTIPLFKTEKGELSKNIRLNEIEYFYSLDSVELSKEMSKEIDNILN